MNVHDDDFALFGLARQFVQDPAQIDARWKALQRQVHPDKFAAQGAAAQRQAMQWSVRINEAYARLKDPLKRASYLCELHGAPINAHTNTAMPSDFMMMQIEWREALEEAKTAEDLDKIELETANYQRKVLSKIEHCIDVEHDFVAAANAVRSLMFVARFVGEIEARQDQM